MGAERDARNKAKLEEIRAKQAADRVKLVGNQDKIAENIRLAQAAVNTGSNSDAKQKAAYDKLVENVGVAKARRRIDDEIIKAGGSKSKLGKWFK